MTEGTGMQPQRLVIHYLLAIFLVVFSYLFFTSMDAYVIDGEQLLVNPALSDDLAGWTVIGNADLVQVTDGVVVIRHDSVSQYNSLTQCWDRERFPDRILFSINASTDDLVLGEKAWHQARSGLIGYLPDGKIDYGLSSKLLVIKTDEPWRSYQAGLEINESLIRICISIGLHKSKGIFQFSNPALYPARILPLYSLLKNLLLLVWLGASLYWLTRLLKHYRHKKQLVFLMIMLVMITAGILMPAGFKSFLDGSISYYIPEFRTSEILNALGVSVQIPSTIIPQYWDISKFGHLLGFFFLSMILFSEKQKPVWSLLSGLVLAAMASEILQYYVPGRVPRVSDAIVDLIGIMAGWWLIRGYFRLRHLLAGY
jgi:VanZ family protein